MSRFYIRNNMVIAHPSEIKAKEEINTYTHNMVKTGGNKNDNSKND